MIKSATQKVATVSQALGTALYASAGADSQEGAPADDGVEDAEIVEEQK
jgi:molecular chaperone DnaK